MADRRKIADLPAALLLALIRLYQFAFSPLLRMAAGPGCGCRFHPHCSAYALDAVRAHGAVRGSWLAAVRLARCHPGSAGGWDPAPPAENRWRCVRTVS